MLMLQCFAAAATIPRFARACASGWRDLVDLAERASGEPPEVISAFFAKGMLLNVLSAMELVDDPTPWATG